MRQNISGTISEKAETHLARRISTGLTSADIGSFNQLKTEVDIVQPSPDSVCGGCCNIPVHVHTFDFSRVVRSPRWQSSCMHRVHALGLVKSSLHTTCVTLDPRESRPETALEHGSAS